MMRGGVHGVARAPAVLRLVGILGLLGLAPLTVTSCITPDFDGLKEAEGGAGGEGNAAHCYDEVSNKGETGIDCGGGECDGCAEKEPCRIDRDCESNSCGSGKCLKPSCDDLKTNPGETGPDCGGSSCDARCDVGLGCDSNKDCLAPPRESGASARCENQTCALACPPRTGDCNEQADDACEVNTESNSTHCGECFKTCDLSHVSDSFCVSGACQVDTTAENLGCDPGYSDCDGLVENGCEARLSTDLKNCGACSAACSAENGQARCEAGECQITCQTGFKDCNNDPRSDGCETDITSSVNDCGGCGEDDSDFICVPDQPGWSPYCIDKKCGSIDCEETAPGHGACDGDKICDDSLDTVRNCSACGQICVATGGSPACVERVCVIGGCNPDRADCDGAYLTGCEADLLLDKTHCGGCTRDDPRPGPGQNCVLLEEDEDLHVLTVACAAGGCAIVSCEPGHADCDGRAENGCEIDVSTTDRHCGGCTKDDPKPGAGEDCEKRFDHASGECEAGSCVFDDCDEGYVDCGGDAGCETDIEGPHDCGECDVRCGGDQAHVASTPRCVESKCEVTCEQGHCPDLSDPERPCSAEMGVDVQNCEACGETCGGSEPFCDPDLGCRQLFPIQVVGTVAVRSGANGALTSPFALTNPETARGRALVVTIATPRAVGTVRFGGVNMIQGSATSASGDAAYSYVYYLLSSALGAPGTKNLEIAIPGGWGGIVATPIELINVAQAPPVWTAAIRATNNPCSAAGGTYKARQTAEVSLGGSWVLSSLSIRADSSSGATPTGLGAVVSGAQLGQQSQGFSGYSLTNRAADLAIGWDVQGGACWDLAMSSLAFSPVTQDGPSD
jgi:hypothetical protein